MTWIVILYVFIIIVVMKKGWNKQLTSGTFPPSLWPFLVNFSRTSWACTSSYMLYIKMPRVRTQLEMKWKHTGPLEIRICPRLLLLCPYLFYPFCICIYGDVCVYLSNSYPFVALAATTNCRLELSWNRKTEKNLCTN